jgi:hypothetical protein
LRIRNLPVPMTSFPSSFSIQILDRTRSPILCYLDSLGYARRSHMTPSPCSGAARMPNMCLGAFRFLEPFIIERALPDSNSSP